MGDRVLIVTGGGRGIGAATARLAAGEGYAVGVNYRADHEAAHAVVADIVAGGGRALALAGDVAREADVAALFDAVASELGPVTALVNNAGITGSAGRLENTSVDTLRRVLEVNVLGAMLCAREAVRRMSTRRGGRGGAVVNVSSAAATLGSPGEYVWYAASKAAVDGLTLGLAREVAGEGIRVNAVSPGLVATDIHGPGRLERLTPQVPMARVGTAEEVARAILWLLSDAASYCAGANVRIGGGR